MAEVLLREVVRDHATLTDLDVGSAGLAARENDRASDEAIGLMLERGLDLTRHRSRRLTPRLGGEVDLILTMTSDHTARVRRLCGNETPVMTLGDFAGTGEAVGDPFMADLDDYRQVAAQLARLIDAVVPRLLNERTGGR